MILIEVFLVVLGGGILFAIGWLALDYRDLRNKVRASVEDITEEFAELHREVNNLNDLYVTLANRKRSE